MRRRQQIRLPEPPPQLLTFNPAEWFPLVDASAYNPQLYRNRGVNGPYGEPLLSFENWRNQEARLLWGRARRAWHAAHGGWPGELSPLDLLRQEMGARRSAFSPIRDNESRRNERVPDT